MEYNLPDELGADYGASDTPVVKMPGSARVVPPPQQSQSIPPNPYAQYGKPPPTMKRPTKQQQVADQWPRQEIDGYNMQMIRGTPNVAPLLIDQVSPTPFNRGDFDPVYNLTGKPYNFAKGPTYQGYGGFMDVWNSFWSQGLPKAPITGASDANQRMALGQALAYIGAIPTATDDFNQLSIALQTLQQAGKIQPSGFYDSETQKLVAQGFAAKRQGKALEDAWKQAESSGILPDWWTTTPPSTEIVDYTKKDTGTSDYVKYGLIALAIIGSITGLALYMRSKKKEE